MTLKQREQRILNVLHMAADGCLFAGSRAFNGGTCAQENGRGYNCTACEARELIKELVDPPVEPCPDCNVRDCGGAPRFVGLSLEERMVKRAGEALSGQSSGEASSQTRLKLYKELEHIRNELSNAPVRDGGPGSITPPWVTRLLERVDRVLKKATPEIFGGDCLDLRTAGCGCVCNQCLRVKTSHALCEYKCKLKNRDTVYNQEHPSKVPDE